MLSLCQQTTYVSSEVQQRHAAAVHVQVGVVLILTAERSTFKLHTNMHMRPQGCLSEASMGETRSAVKTPGFVIQAQHVSP